jgi:hypothetical protein
MSKEKPLHFVPRVASSSSTQYTTHSPRMGLHPWP